jgi:NADH-ubiquinone oxidoreductase chain 1
VLLSGSLDLNTIIEYQKGVLFIYPLLPLFIIFLIGGIAETNRAPFDLAEAESELVSGFMTEHAAVIFVFFFLAEYASIVLICILISILFFGGYMYNITYYLSTDFISQNIQIYFYNTWSILQIITEGTLSGILLGVKSCIMVFIFI